MLQLKGDSNLLHTTVQFEQFLSLTLEIELTLLVSYDLGEVLMSIACIEFFDFGRIR